MIDQRQARGHVNYRAGQAAEQRIEQVYVTRGHTVLARRWRGQAGEIDLVCEKDGVISFVEVKQASSFAQAAARLKPAQMQRIFHAAEEFLGECPQGSLTDCTFDVGLVNGRGAYEIVENAHCLH